MKNLENPKDNSIANKRMSCYDVSVFHTVEYIQPGTRKPVRGTELLDEDFNNTTSKAPLVLEPK